MHLSVVDTEVSAGTAVVTVQGARTGLRRGQPSTRGETGLPLASSAQHSGRLYEAAVQVALGSS